MDNHNFTQDLTSPRPRRSGNVPYVDECNPSFTRSLVLPASNVRNQKSDVPSLKKYQNDTDEEHKERMFFTSLLLLVKKVPQANKLAMRNEITKIVNKYAYTMQPPESRFMRAPQPLYGFHPSNVPFYHPSCMPYLPNVKQEFQDAHDSRIARMPKKRSRDTVKQESFNTHTGFSDDDGSFVIGGKTNFSTRRQDLPLMESSKRDFDECSSMQDLIVTQSKNSCDVPPTCADSSESVKSPVLPKRTRTETMQDGLIDAPNLEEHRDDIEEEDRIFFSSLLLHISKVPQTFKLNMRNEITAVEHEELLDGIETAIVADHVEMRQARLVEEEFSGKSEIPRVNYWSRAVYLSKSCVRISIDLPLIATDNDNNQRRIAEQQQQLAEQQRLAERQWLDNQRLEQQLADLQAQLALRQNELANALPPPAAAAVQPAIHRVAVKLPAFWSERPSLWFAQADSQFTLSDITSEVTKFRYVVFQLDARIALEVEDVITSPPAVTPYTFLRAKLIERLSASEEQRVRQLISEEELGDRKPSQFLRHLRSLAGNTIVQDNLLRQLWLQRLPSHVLFRREAHPNIKLASIIQWHGRAFSPSTKSCDHGTTKDVGLALHLTIARRASTPGRCDLCRRDCQVMRAPSRPEDWSSALPRSDTSIARLRGEKHHLTASSLPDSPPVKFAAGIAGRLAGCSSCNTIIDRQPPFSAVSISAKFAYPRFANNGLNSLSAALNSLIRVLLYRYRK
ncbi:unnamed protein product [Trichogramma brassicae]|uniref:BESS domain-containing protein n=1 Tax=Trichogramma brassicae TaxID=86971 RepID=A0A6H5ICS8_9HYME|nr:unnamed protein product [Trichogramma brassicae]